MISENEFNQLGAQGYNRIPMMAEALADLETPLSLYLKLAFDKDGGKYSFLLESVVGGERFSATVLSVYPPVLCCVPKALVTKPAPKW